MSGGFFRGTSADQDTRFSNKQAKLLKSQKFAPELDHLVDMSKVKMDVIRPWIAARATELLGFEDEVLINFVYGLLDGKVVDGKQIQIQLTGFMEKNTGKFMKELWSLLLSAQQNASGVPQQFLDAKEEEMRKKKAETDRITQEIQKRKEREGREVERGRQIRMDGEADILRSADAVSDSVSKRSLPRVSSVQSEEEREADVRHDRRTKNWYSKSPHSSKSPHPNDHSLSIHRNSPSATRSSSKSFSKSRSYSEERPKSRSLSVSSQPQRHIISPERRYRSPPRHSISPARRYRSPPRRSISPRRRYSPRNTRSPSRRNRQRSGSHPRHRSPSPSRRRSPHARRRSPFLRRRPPSPLRRRSPSPSRRRSPIRRRSPSPSRRRSPIRRKSLSPARRRSPSPLRRRSPPPRSPKHRRRSPLHSPRNRAADSQISPRRRKRSRSPYRSRSPSYRTRRSLSRERDGRTNGVESKRYRDEYASHRTREKRSPLHHALDREVAERPDSGRKVSDTISSRLRTSLRSPQRDSRDQSDIRNRMPIVPPEKSPNRSGSPNHIRKTNPSKNRRSRSSSESPVKQIMDRVPRYDSPEPSREEEQSRLAREEARRRIDSLHNKSEDLTVDKGLTKFHASDFSPEVHSPDRSAENRAPSSRSHAVKLELRKDHEERRDMDLAEKHVRRVSPSSEGVEYGPGKLREETFSPDDLHDKQRSTKQHARDASSLEEREYNEQAMKHTGVDGRRVRDEKRSHSKSDEYRVSHYEKESITKSKRKEDKSNLPIAIGSDSEETERYKFPTMEKRRHKKSDKHKKDVDEGSESESEIDDRKEAKRRKKDEKRLRKEERRRRREERHRRRLERRASKLKAKSMDTVAPPSDIENNLNNSDESDGDAAIRKDFHPSETEEPESEQKKLEIELRKKALESLRAKKAISH